MSDTEANDVDILSGAFMLCRTSLLQQVGGFDEDFFMYGEDIDLSYRMAKAGYHNRFIPAPILHYKGESTKKDSMRYVRVFYEAMLIFYRKHYPRYSWVCYPIVQLGVALRASLAMCGRLFKRMRPPRKSEPRRWVILSDNAVRVSLATGINHYSRALPEKSCVSVLLDDETYSYDQIVTFIASHHREGVEFHIYSHTAGLVISPKMSHEQSAK